MSAVNETVNEALLNESIAHAIYLDRYANYFVQYMIDQLNQRDKELLLEIAKVLKKLDTEPFNITQLDTLLSTVSRVNTAVFNLFYKELRVELRQLATYEAQHQYQLLRVVLPFLVRSQVGVNKINVQNTFSAAMSTPFRGKLLRQWVKKLGVRRLERIKDLIVISYSEKSPSSEVLRKLRGTQAKAYSDGMLKITRQDATTIIRTAMSHTTSTIQAQFYERNRELIKALKWVSTLDTKTSSECMIRDGLLYKPVTHEPIKHQIQWLEGPGKIHFNCRSVSTPIIKSYKELGINTTELNASECAHMNGQAPKNISFKKWLAEQTDAQRQQVLGAKRAKMYQEQGLTLNHFFSEKGDFLTLKELEKSGFFYQART